MRVYVVPYDSDWIEEGDLDDAGYVTFGRLTDELEMVWQRLHRSQFKNVSSNLENALLTSGLGFVQSARGTA